MHALAHLLPALPGLGGPKTHAAWPVWKDSTTAEVTWRPLPKKAAVKAWHQARDFERRTRQPGRQDGALGRNGLAVLSALIFDFLDFASGRLEPAIASIAKKAAISPRSAARGLAALKKAGVLFWLRRCSGGIEDGRFRLRQITNAYVIQSPSHWRGYTPPKAPPVPEPGTWGDHPPLPLPLAAAVAESREAGGVAEVLRALESDPEDALATALARLLRGAWRRET